MASKLPSGLASSTPRKLSFSEDVPQNAGPNIILYISILALILSGVAIYLSLTSQQGLSAQDKTELKAIAEDLRQIQQKEIVMTSPLKTTVLVQKTFPITDLFSKDFKISIDESFPIDAEVVAVSSTGQIVNLHVADNLRIKGDLPLGSSKSLEGATFEINKEIPLETRFSATLKVNTVYGKELNDMISRIESIAQK
ncbi:MAG: hypothetical protein WC492_02625 [Candidatus Micrarchaeia archaeon]